MSEKRILFVFSSERTAAEVERATGIMSIGPGQAIMEHRFDTILVFIRGIDFEACDSRREMFKREIEEHLPCLLAQDGSIIHI